MSASRDAPRLLHRRSQYGYTTDVDRALYQEPEAVPRDDQAVITARAHRSAREAQLVEWRERRAAIERQLSWLNSRRFERNVTTQVRALQRQLDRIDKRIASG
ncbi:MAG: hypothetical protein ACXVSF_06455 [Solirubrobacteraceae bacterium]